MNSTIPRNLDSSGSDLSLDWITSNNHTCCVSSYNDRWLMSNSVLLFITQYHHFVMNWGNYGEDVVGVEQNGPECSLVPDLWIIYYIILFLNRSGVHSQLFLQLENKHTNQSLGGEDVLFLQSCYLQSWKTQCGWGQRSSTGWCKLTSCRAK